MKQIFQPYEAHLQYLLQWMIDYNLYGCDYIDSKKVYFRGSVPKYDELDNLSHLWHDRSVSESYCLGDELPRDSHCSLEVDILVQDITNRLTIKERQLHHGFIELANPRPLDEKLVHSMAGLWQDETRRWKSKMANPDPGSSPFPPEVMISMSADPRNSQAGGWIHEDEFREKAQILMDEERNKAGGREISIDTFVQPQPFEASVNTAFSSVADLYPENLAPILGLKFSMETATVEEAAEDEIEVDESRIFNDNGDEFPYDSDEDDIMGEMELSEQKESDGVEPEFVDHEDMSKAEQKPKIAGTEVRPDQLVGFNSRKSHDQTSEESTNSSKSFDTNITPERLYPISRMSPGPPKSDEYSSSHSGADPISSSTIVPDGLSSETRLSSEGHVSTSKCRIMPRKVDSVHQSKKFHTLSQVGEQLDNEYVKDGIELDCSVRMNRKRRHSAAALVVPTVNELNHRPIKAHKASTGNLQPRVSASPQTLNFPIVKNPHDPSTILRLSQGGQSQKSVDSSQTKQLSFRAPVSTTEDTQTSGTSTLRPDATPEQIKTVTKVVANSRRSFGLNDRTHVFAFREVPPTSAALASTWQDYGISSAIYQEPYYSNEADVPERVREYAGREFRLEGAGVRFLPEFDPTGNTADIEPSHEAAFEKRKDDLEFLRQNSYCNLRTWEIAEPPPTVAEVHEWHSTQMLKAESTQPTSSKTSSLKLSAEKILSQIEGPTQRNKHGFKFTQKEKSTSVQHQTQYMSTMSLEIHVNTRGKFLPNPEEDEVQCVFWCLQSEDESLDNSVDAEGTHAGIVVLSEDGELTKKVAREVAFEVRGEDTELDLLVRMVEIVRTHDPDILTGYEVHRGSWGYLIERARLKYDYNLNDEFSRMKTQSHGRFGKEADRWGFNHTSSIQITGRHMINIWRAMRGELNLLQYTLENVVFHMLHRRVPHYAWRDLTSWYTSGRPADLAKVLNYFTTRVLLDLAILDGHEVITRTSEQARLLGVDFFSVFSRGSQFKVESLMFRIAKPENFMLVSPSRKQVGSQNALECLPLVMEPQSAFYNSPLLVLDFQSLYPSVMIAYNYCYSTFLGRVLNWRGTNKMGFADYKRQKRLLELLKDYINIAPNGMMYAKPHIRKSLLAKMLVEILETRVMVKSGMKQDTDDKTLQRLLNNRQLALKLIANVTYGYTSASFSGRMPCSEIADSIVQTGRETLEKAIALIHSVNRWNAEVVYGDTDSIFVYLKGRTKDQAFDIGNEIAKAVTNLNPRPVKLKFEKVYFPCVLLAKKRYVGFKYEHKDQTKPDFDAKGIETVRRDGTPAGQKIEEKALKILFRTADLSQVKSYFQEQCQKIMKGSVSVQDFCFAKEVRLGTYSDKGPPPPGALIVTQRMLEDHRAEPQYGERVPYVVVTGAPGSRLIDRCVDPETLLKNDHIGLDAEYYISKNIIPPLERIFNLVGANVRNWYDEMPKFQRIRRVEPNPHFLGESRDMVLSKKTLESYMKSSACLVCQEKVKSEDPLCESCLIDPSVSMLSVRTRLTSMETKTQALDRVCQSCSGLAFWEEVKCDSKDCPVFYSRTKERTKLSTESAIVGPLMKLLQESVVDRHDLEW
jgi:DNA polymerase zeta